MVDVVIQHSLRIGNALKARFRQRLVHRFRLLVAMRHIQREAFGVEQTVFAQQQVAVLQLRQTLVEHSQRLVVVVEIAIANRQVGVDILEVLVGMVAFGNFERHLVEFNRLRLVVQNAVVVAVELIAQIAPVAIEHGVGVALHVFDMLNRHREVALVDVEGSLLFAGVEIILWEVVFQRLGTHSVGLLIEEFCIF